MSSEQQRSDGSNPGSQSGTPGGAGRIVLFATPDIEATIGAPGVLEDRLGPDRIVREFPLRFDVLSQRLEGIPKPPDHPEDAADWVARSRTAAVDSDAALVVTSLHTELLDYPVVRHRASGWLALHPSDQSSWGEDAVAWFDANFETVPRPTTEESTAALDSIAGRLNDESRRLVVFNVSTYDPMNRTHRFEAGVPLPFGVRANRLIAGLQTLSSDRGVLVVDVDTAVAELGAREHVPRAGDFSPAAGAMITEDALALLDQSSALGESLQAPIMRLEIPRYDRRVASGTVMQWHVDPGQSVQQGDALLDVRFDGLHYKIREGESARSAAKRAAKKRGISNRALRVRMVAGTVGFVREVMVSEGDRTEVGATAAIITPAPTEEPVTADASTPAFRLGMRLVED